MSCCAPAFKINRKSFCLHFNKIGLSATAWLPSHRHQELRSVIKLFANLRSENFPSPASRVQFLGEFGILSCGCCNYWKRFEAEESWGAVKIVGVEKIFLLWKSFYNKRRFFLNIFIQNENLWALKFKAPKIKLYVIDFHTKTKFSTTHAFRIENS